MPCRRSSIASATDWETKRSEAFAHGSKLERNAIRRGGVRGALYQER